MIPLPAIHRLPNAGDHCLSAQPKVSMNDAISAML